MEKKKINWYTEQELITWLKHNKYSENIAKELAPMLLKNFNSAFKKGFEVGLQGTIISITESLPDIDKEVLFFVCEKNGTIHRTLGYRSKDKADPMNKNGYVFDWPIDGNVIAYSYLPTMS